MKSFVFQSGFCFALLLAFPPVFAADAPGGAVYGDIGRYEGSEFIEYRVEDYGTTVFATGPVQKDSDAEDTTLSDEPELRIIVVGHTDYVGGFDYNMGLSKRRAKAVRDALIADYGIAEGRLASDGVGYLAPIAPNASEVGRALNRRVELVRDKPDE